MERFIMDGNNQRIIRVKDDMPENVAFNEAYAQYIIPYSDKEALIAALKSSGDIQPEIRIKEVPVQVGTNVAAGIYDDPEKIVNTQANIIDKQLGIIQTLLNK